MMNRKVKQQISAKLNELNMNLANNYKDLAHDALKELEQTVENLKRSGELKEKDYIKIRQTVDDYKKEACRLPSLTGARRRLTHFQDFFL